MHWFGRRLDPDPEPGGAVQRSGGAAPTMVAELEDGPLAGRSVDVEAVEGRPPKTVDVAADGGTCRYCLAKWTQAGHSATYTFLYRL